MCGLIRDLFPKYTLDDSIYREVPLRKNEVLWILNEGIKIHRQYISRTDDDELLLGSDLMHESMITLYETAIYVVNGGIVDGHVKEYLIEKFKWDAAEHNRIINEGTASAVMGDVAWQTKWYFRWLAVASFIENL